MGVGGFGDVRESESSKSIIMSELEQQTEEIEALNSIYDGDNCYKQLSSTTFQYKYGDEGNSDKVFMLEIVWGPEYPNVLPTISMDTYLNRNISQEFKSKVTEVVTAEGENWLGCGMTYTLFECVKEHLLDDLKELWEQEKLTEVTEAVKTVQLKTEAANPAESTKKEQLTKSQKRRMWDKADSKGNRPRGYNWVDIIRHLSQTGTGQSAAAADSPATVTVQQS